jgi:iron complex outermembrane receptor protein
MMMNRYFKAALYLSTAVSIGATLPAPASAQTAGPDESAAAQIEQVVVTATRREEKLQDVPISITVFNQQELSNRNVTNASDLAAYTPSLGVNTNFGGQNTSFSIRGFVQDIGTEPSVGVFFADVVAPRGPTQGTTAGDGAGPGDFFDLENVQVLKGPQGTLFGRNTTGGDILIVPKKPTGDFGGYVQGSIGNYGMEGIQGVINVPVNDHIRLRFGVDHMNRDGYVKNTSGIGPKDFDDVDYTAVRASADIDITPDLNTYTIATYSQSDTNGDFQKMVACNPNANTLFTSPLLAACNQLTPHANVPFSALTPYQGGDFYDAAQSHPNPYSKTREWRIINKTSWHASDNLTVNNIASYARFKDDLSAPLFGTNFYTPDLSAIHGLGIPSYSVDFANESLIPGTDNTDQDTWTEEFQLQGNNLDNRLTWQAGLYAEGSDPVKQGGYQSPVLAACTDVAHLQCVDPLGYILSDLAHQVPGGTQIASVNYTVGETFYNNYAGYAQATYKLTDEFSFTGGYRYTWDREANTSVQRTYHFPYPNIVAPTDPTTVTSSCTFPGSTATCSRRFVQKSEAPTWYLEGDLKPDQDTMIYAKWSRGYRAGVIVQNISYGFNNVQPEKIDDYEVGAKTTFHGMIEGTFDIDGFFNDFRNQQLLLGFNTNPNYCGIGCPSPVSPTAAPVNAGQSHIFGLELSSSIIPFEGATLSVDYTYLHTRLVSVRTFTLPPNSLYIITGAQKTGDELPLSPHNKLTVSASYDLPLDPDLGKITLGTTFVHTDRQLTNYEDRDLVGTPFANLSYIQPTDLLTLNATWASIMQQPVDLSVFATNVTGQKYYTWVPGLAPGEGFETAELGAPTMYGARLTYHFGED